MSKHYIKLTGSFVSVCRITVLGFFLLASGRASAQLKDSTVTGIYTSFKSYWSTSTTAVSAIQPDTSHNLLAFTFRGKTYSTGVNDAILTTNLGSANYLAHVFKALPVNNIEGTVGTGTYIVTASKNDGDSTKAAYTSPYPNIRIADVLTDGANGLDLGTGVSNLPVGAHISFAIKNLSAKAATDTVPDLVFTQIADPVLNKSDTIFFYDINGKLVGNKKLVNWNSVNKLGTYKLDVYTMSLASCNTSIINGIYPTTPTRNIRMVAFLLTEFGITNADSAAKVKGIQINPNGTSDQAFIAYNTNLISIDAPIITAQPQTQTFCSNATTSATFSVTSGSSNDTYQWKENGAYITGATSSSYTASGLTLADTANAYSVTVTNTVGSVTSSNAYVKYVIVTQPTSLYVATSSPASFTVTASGATAFQWQKNAVNINGATAATVFKPAVALSDAGSYKALVTYSGGTCPSNVATLTVEDLPVITAQPQAQVLCNSSVTSATFSITATSTSAMSYQWYKNNVVISGATSSSYTASGLTYADTLATYKVIATNGVGYTTSSSVGFKYLVLTQPVSQYIMTGTSATFSVTASSIATGYQWQKGGTNISGATLRTYTIPAVALSDSGSYAVVVSYSGGSCTSSTATLRVENAPVITTQPALQVLCNSSTTSATYSVVATSTSALSYQWYNNGTAIPGATSSSYTATGLSYGDTVNTYSVKLINGVGFTTSNTAGLTYLILSQPSPATSYLATGNTITFTAAVSSAAIAFQWRKDGVAISGATALSYKIDTVTTASAGHYRLAVLSAGGSCTSSAGIIATSTTLYSKATGDLNNPGTWGVMPDGSGSSPVDFTRPEHTFIVSNRPIGVQDSNLVIAGTYDLANATTTIYAGTTLEAGRIIRSSANGKLSGTATSGLIVHGKSDLYFNADSNMLQTLTVNTTDTVKLHTALNITAGSGHGIVKVLAGTFSTGDSLTLKSDANGTASVGNSPGRITGKVTVERFIPAHRSWRLFTAPVFDSLAPTIHDAWQEGAVSSTDNPHPGYGTHITYGATSDGFDQNPQKSFSLKVRAGNGAWINVPPTNTTRVTDYPAYFLFIRGDRSYDIGSTTNTTTPQPTIIRTTGYLRQHTQPNATIGDTSFTLVANPYASPVDFESVYQRSSNIAHHVWMWNPNLVGDKGTGAYVLAYWNGSGYSTTPVLTGANNFRFLQAYEGFFVEGNGSGSHLSVDEGDKDTASILTPFGREAGDNTSRLEINLNVFNADNTTSPADGIAYLFDQSFTSNIDGDDIRKLTNGTENLSIALNGKKLAVEQHAELADKDSLQLDLTHTKSTKYQLQIIPNKMDNISLYLYDRYLDTKTPISATDTNRITIDINTAVEASKAANRFVIVSKTIAPVSVAFTHISAAAKEAAIQVDWSTINEANVVYYTVERSADGSNFTEIGNVTGLGSKTYSFTDSKPLKGINYYRVKSVNRTGAPSYTGVVSEVWNKDIKSYVAVYPNPLTGNHCTIELHNKPAGKYELTLLNSKGSVVFTTSISVAEGNSRQPLLLPASLAKGVYQLQVEGLGKQEIIRLLRM